MSEVYIIGHRETTMWQWHPKEISEGVITDYKIGFGDVETRIGQMKVGTPHKLEIVATIDSPDPVSLEERLHAYFFPQNKVGEWYKLNDEHIGGLKEFDCLRPAVVTYADKHFGVFDDTPFKQQLEIAQNVLGEA